MTDPREAAALPPDDLAEWIVGRFESPISPRARAGLLDDIEAAIRYRDGVRKGTAAGLPAETGPEGALDRPDEQAVAEALAWMRENTEILPALDNMPSPWGGHAATIVRAALAAGPDGLRPSSRSTAAAHRLIAWLDEHPGSVAMDIRMVLADRSRGWNAYRRAALAGPRPAAEPDILAGYTGEDSDPELTADMAQAVAAEWDAVDARDATRPAAEPVHDSLCEAEYVGEAPGWTECGCARRAATTRTETPWEAQR